MTVTEDGPLSSAAGGYRHHLLSKNIQFSDISTYTLLMWYAFYDQKGNMMSFRSEFSPWLRVENAIVSVVLLGLYYHFGAGWWMFALLILVPDLSALGYLVNKRVGAICYNTAHSYAWPAILIGLGALPNGADMTLAIGLIWACHIAIDRAVGYGLKSRDDHHETHLGRMGKG